MYRRFITITLFLAFAAMAISIAFPAAAAQSGCNIEFTPAVGIPGSDIFKAGVPIQLNCSSVGEYVKAVYTFSVYAGSILAVVVLMIGGFMWLTSGGNVSQVGQARSYIGGAIAGFVLLLLSWTLLQTINPKLVEFRPLNISDIGRINLLPAPKTFCCVCEDLSGAPEDRTCDNFSFTNEGGECVCPGLAPERVDSKEACQLKGSNCSFSLSIDAELRDDTERACAAVGVTNGVTCTLAASSERCAEQNACMPAMARAGLAGWCDKLMTTTSRECARGTICNEAWLCNSALDRGTPRARPGENFENSDNPFLQTLTYCCKPSGQTGDICLYDSECASGYTCAGAGDPADFHLGYLGGSDTLTMGSCQPSR